MTTQAAIEHCQRPLATREPVPCVICGEECRTVRDAYRHCQQPNTQRGGYAWRNYTPLDERHRQRMDEIKSDPKAMREIHAVACWLLKDVV